MFTESPEFEAPGWGTMKAGPAQETSKTGQVGSGCLQTDVPIAPSPQCLQWDKRGVQGMSVSLHVPV